MEALGLERRALQRLVAQALGQSADQNRLTTGQMRAVGFERDVAALPGALDAATSIQTASGAMIFMPGISDPDGDDELI